MTVPHQINLLLKMMHSLASLVIPPRGLITWTIQSMNADVFLIVKRSETNLDFPACGKPLLLVFHLASVW